RRVRADPDRRPADAVGLVLRPRHALFQLAARARALRGARLRRRARALPPARPEPLAPLLGARRAPLPRLARAARLAPRARAGAARLHAGRVAVPARARRPLQET